MTFDSSKPNANESPSQFPAQAQTNWQRIETIVSGDHQWNDSADASDGKHVKARFPEQTSAPSTAANEAALYSKEAQSVSQMFIRRESDGAEVQITSSDVSDTTAQSTNGYSCLPGGVLIQWGKKSSPGSSGSVTFPKAFSAAPYSLSVDLQRSSGNQSVTVSSSSAPTTSSFSYLSSSGGSTFLYWIAIGPA